MNKEPKSVEITLDKTAGVSSSPASVKSRLTDVENLTKAILWVGIISVVGVIITCCTLVIDQMHFNNQTYKDQSSLNDVKLQEFSTRIELLNRELESQKAAAAAATAAAAASAQ
jgi:hypothetical protein